MTDVWLTPCPPALRERAAQIVGGEVADPPTVDGGDLVALLPAGLRPGRTWPRGDDLVGLMSGGLLVVLAVEVVGGCGRVGDLAADGCQEIGYGLAPAYQGRGLGTAAVALLVAMLEARPEVRALSADVLPGNEPSWRLLERLGFVRTGEVRDGHLHYRRG